MSVDPLEGEQAELQLRDLVFLAADRDLALLGLARADVLDDGDRAALDVLDLVLELLAPGAFVKDLAVEVLSFLDEGRGVELVGLHAVEEAREPPDDGLLPFGDRGRSDVGGPTGGGGGLPRRRGGRCGRSGGRRRNDGLGGSDPVLHRPVVSLDPLPEHVGRFLDRGRRALPTTALGLADGSDPALEDAVRIDRGRGAPAGRGRGAEPRNILRRDAGLRQVRVGEATDLVRVGVAGAEERFPRLGRKPEGPTELRSRGGASRRAHRGRVLRRTVHGRRESNVTLGGP